MTQHPFFFSVSGGELFERVAENDCLTEKEAAYYMHQLLQGLQHMHNKNIVHLDLKVRFSLVLRPWGIHSGGYRLPGVITVCLPY